MPAAPAHHPNRERISPSEIHRQAERVRPTGFAVGRQRWNQLLFAHWSLDPALVQAALPPGLFVDTFHGAAYVGIVPFFMERIRPAGLPPVPWLSWFMELNVRTYVHDAAGRPGVWFYSLDCNQPVAVALARRFFHLPYFHATMRARRDGATWHYTSQRRGRSPGRADRFEWTPDPAQAAPAEPGSLEHFLIERYRLFSADAQGSLHTGSVHHAPYRIHRPRVAACSTEAARLAGFELSGDPVSLLAADAVDVAIFPLAPLLHLAPARDANPLSI